MYRLHRAFLKKSAHFIFLGRYSEAAKVPSGAFDSSDSTTIPLGMCLRTFALRCSVSARWQRPGTGSRCSGDGALCKSHKQAVRTRTRQAARAQGVGMKAWSRRPGIGHRVMCTGTASQRAAWEGCVGRNDGFLLFFFF